MPAQQNTLFNLTPDGFRYQDGILSPDEEHALAARIAQLPLKEFEFHGYTGKRRVISYGWHYDFGKQKVQPADEIPEFLHAVRERAAVFAGVAAADLPHALITEYGPGAAIGWHRDKGVFDDVIGISLLSP